jgi:hypothetical protein
MKRIRLIGLALMAVFALSTAAVATASGAEPTKILPEPTAAKPLTGKGKSGPGTLLTVGGSQVTCKSDTSEFSFTSFNEGTYKVLFTECKGPSGTTCTREGDGNGLIALEGKIRYLLALLKTSGTLVAALVFEITEFTFNCVISIIKVPVKVKGCAAAHAEPTDTTTLTTNDVFKEFSSGVPDIESVLGVEKTTEELCETLTSVSGGAFEQSAQTGTVENSGFSLGGGSILLMNK